MDPSQQPQRPIVPVPEPAQAPLPVSPTPEVQGFQAPITPTLQPAATAEAFPQQVAPAPVWSGSPVQPAQPVVFSPPPSGVNKKLIIIISCVVGALVLIGVTIAILIAVFSVSKKDYSAALTQYNAVSEANYTLSSKLSTLHYGVSSTTDTSFDNDADAAKKAIADVKSKNADLAKSKAVSIGDGATKYKAFDTKLQTYLAYNSDLLASLQSARNAASTCDNADSSSGSISAIKSAIDTCVAALDKVSSVADADVKAFMSKIKDEYTKLSSIISQLAAITDPYGKQYDQYRSLRDQMYAASDNITNAQTDFSSNLQKHIDASSPKDAADALSKYLEDKSTN